MKKTHNQNGDNPETGRRAKRAYKKPEVKKYPLVQQTTGYVIYYYVT